MTDTYMQLPLARKQAEMLLDILAGEIEDSFDQKEEYKKELQSIYDRVQRKYNALYGGKEADKRNSQP